MGNPFEVAHLFSKHFPIIKDPNYLIISSEFPPQPGGIGNHAYHLANELKQSGNQVSVITNSRHNSEQQIEAHFDKALSFKVTRTPFSRFRLRTYVTRLSQIFSALKNHTGARVIASGKFSIWALAAGSLLFPANRYFAVLHGTELRPAKTAAKILMRFCLNRMERLCCVSEFTRNRAIRLDQNLNPVVIHNGFGLSSYDSRGNKNPLKGSPSMITVGNITQRKGQHNVILALPAICQKWPDIHYHMVGIPTEKARIKKLAEELGVEKHISFHGPVDNQHLYEMLGSSDVFMMLSEQLQNGDVEGFGITILEANHFGVPAIGSRDSGIVEAIKDGYSGKVVNQNNTAEIADAISTILDKYPFYQANAKAWSEKFRWERVIAQYLEAFQ